ncbi:MAG: DNA alkylation repair protein [Rhizobiaceae bacterium]|nr:DNA alkylation repair protein [Rhizobiaceae bacterium]
MEPFKNVFSPQLVSCIADHMEKHIAGFARRPFEKSITDKLKPLEFKARAQLISDNIHLALPSNNAERVRILFAMLHPDKEESLSKSSDEKGICGWGVQPLTTVVGQHGIEDFDRSMELLREMTMRSSSEFAIRFFLLADQERALNIMRGWLNDPNRHVRRLISEGSRPRLPWAPQLPQLMADPSPMLPMLEALRDDQSQYVRRSVANHLNDIAKDHPDLIGTLANDWMKGANGDRKKLIRHACRTLIKQGHKKALEAVGIFPPQIKLEEFNINTPKVIYGEALKFSATLHSTASQPQKLEIDYLVHFKKANGLLAAKVFKWSKFELAPGERRTIERSHPIRPITTRRYYGGTQGLSLRINGEDFADEEFELVMDAEQ